MAAVEVAYRHYSNTDIPVAGTIWDKEHSISELSAWWESDSDGTLIHVIPDEEGLVSGSIGLREGIHEVSLMAMDPEGDTGSHTVVIVVGGPNTPPQCTLEAPEEGAEFARDADIEMWGTVADIDVGPEWLTTQWSSDVDGLIWEGSPSTSGVTGWITDELSVGAHTISLTAIDEVGASCTDSAEIWVGFPPEISWLFPDEGATITQGNAQALLVAISDPEDPPDLLSMSWHSSVEGDFASGLGDEDGWAAAAGGALSLGEHFITVTVTDPDGFTATDTRTVWVVGSPNAPDVVISPPAPRTGDDLKAFAWGSVDPEGEAITYAYSWRKAVTDDPAGDEQILDSSATAKNELWIVTATPWDSDGPGFPGTATTWIRNTKPEVLEVIISPDSPPSNGTASAVTSVTDVDGDSVSLSYSWTVDGKLVSTVDADTLDGRLHFSRDQELVVTVTPDDGTDIGDPMTSDPAIVGNGPPEPPTIYVDPVSPEVDIDDVTCIIETEGTDPDGDLLSYVFSWEADGVPYFDAGSTFWPGDTVPAEDLGYDEAWDCIVHAFDGTDYSDEAFANALTEGAIPTWCEEKTWSSTNYVVCLNLMDWEEAQEVCESVDMFLITIDSSSEQSWMEGVTSDDVWIGLNDMDIEDSWEWIDGGTSSYTNWDTDQPDNYGNQDCVISQTSAGGEWDDMACSDSYDFVCEEP
jgi:hypothetical protein